MSKTCSRWLVQAGAVLVVALGCQNSALPPQANPDEAREALKTALESWKKGGNARDELAGGKPPIYFNDPRCSPDVRLVDFKIDESHGQYGQSVRLSVVLSIRSKDGGVEEKKASYLVDTSPAIVIVPG